MKIKTKLLAALIGLSSAAFGTQETFNISTGVDGANNLIGPGTADDSWTVKVPGSSTFAQAKCVNTLTPWWTGDANCRWISPTADASNYPASNGVAGTHVYRTTVYINNCGTFQAGSIVLNKYGGDDNIFKISINGYDHAISASFATLGTTTVSIPANEFVSGTNTVEISLTNNQLYTGLLVYGSVVANYTAPCCGTNLANACDLGTICSKQVNDINNSVTYYSNNYNTGTGQASRDVWYKFKPQSTGLFEISTCGSSIDTYVHLLDANGTEIAYNDDQYGQWLQTSCSGSLISMMNSNFTGLNNTSLLLVQDQTYYVVVEGYSSYEGLINLQITTCLPCVNTGDGASYATAIDLCISSCSGTGMRNNGDAIFTNSYTSASPSGQDSKDVWYKFTVPPVNNGAGWGYQWYMTTCNSTLDYTYMHLLRNDLSHIASNNIGVNQCNNNPPNRKNSSIDGYLAPNNTNPDYSLSPGTYYVVVEGQGVTTGDIRLNVYRCWGKPTDIEDEQVAAELSLQVFPNPFSFSTTVKIAGGKDNKADVEIFNVNGASVYKKQNHPTSDEIILGDNFPAGVYFVKINTSNEMKTEKLVKIQ